MMYKRAERRGGVTLIELIIVMAILGLSFGIVGIAARKMASRPAPQDTEGSVREQLARARHRALETAGQVVIILQDRGVAHVATAWPDGRVVADSTITATVALDPLSGRLANAAVSR